MRILKVTQSYYPFLDRGGPVTKVRSIARALVNQGHQVTVLSADLGFTPTAIASAEAVREGRIWRSKLDGVDAIYLPTRARYRSLTANTGVTAFCRERLREFDLVHIYGLYDLLGRAVARFCRKLAVPYFVEPMGMTRPIDRGFALKWLWWRLEGGYVARASRIIATSEQERQEIIDSGYAAEMVMLRPNGIDLDEYRELPPPNSFRTRAGIREDEPLIVFLSRIIPRKGADLLIEALPELACTEARLVISGPEGEPGYLDILRDKARRLRVEKRVLFTGPIYGRDKLALLSDATLFALPSRYENFGNVVAEAIACGTPAVVSDQCGVARSVDQRAGLAVPCDVASVARALNGLLGDNKLYWRLKVNCPSVAEELSWSGPISRMLQAYREALSMTGVATAACARA
jgi:glycosyltransferase involved in cell wall biosynthesis